MRKNLYIRIYEFKYKKRLTYCWSFDLSYCLVDEYRYKVLHGDLQSRCRELLIQGCESQGIEILKGVVSSDHVHMHIEYAPKLSVSSVVKSLKGRSSRKLQQEFPSLKKRYWGNHFWASGYGVWSSGNITDKMVNDYLEHHRRKDSNDNSNFILE